MIKLNPPQKCTKCIHISIPPENFKFDSFKEYFSCVIFDDYFLSVKGYLNCSGFVDRKIVSENIYKNKKREVFLQYPPTWCLGMPKWFIKLFN